MKIQNLRKKIDQLDSRLLTLLNQRAKLSSAIGQWKLASGSHVYAPDREEHLLRTLEGKNAGPMPHGALRSIYREILSTSRACQRPLQVACVGRELSNAWVATRRRFGSSDNYQSISSLTQVITGLSRRKLDVGVVDRATLVGLLWEKPALAKKFAVCGDIVLPASRSRSGNGKRTRDVYFLLSHSPVPPTAYSKTVVALECTQSFASVKEWQAAFSVLRRSVLHVEQIKWGKGNSKSRWLVELKGHWTADDLARKLEPTQMIRRSLIVGSYPEVPHYA